MDRRAIAEPRTVLSRLVVALALLLGLVAATPGTVDASTFGDVTKVAHIEFDGATEIDFDGRYAYVGQFNGEFDRQTVAEDQDGGLRVIDLVGDETTAQFEQVGYLNCPGTDNYVRYMDPAVFSPDEGRKYVAMAHHGNWCTRLPLVTDPNTASGYGALNGVAVIDVTDPAAPTIVDSIGHNSAHTVMPHPTRPYLYILPGGIANGTNTSTREISPTAIIDASDPTNLVYVNKYEHNLSGCHDLGWTPDGDYALCAGLGETQVWDVSGDNIEAPVVVNTIVNPAIQFGHNAVVSPSGQYMLINDEAFGFHTCEGEAADLYGSLWIYDISNPELPLLAGRISPPERSGQVGTYAGWVESWCAAHNYNFVPGTDIVVASWFAGGMTAHDISDPLQPELIAAYQPDSDSVMWSAHYYGGYVLTGDMARGVEVLDVPALREAEQAATAIASSGADGSALGIEASVAAPQDRTAELMPAVLPPRPQRPAWAEGGFCVLPGRVTTDG